VPRAVPAARLVVRPRHAPRVCYVSPPIAHWSPCDRPVILTAPYFFAGVL
jgi:hypothetical protein